MLKCMLITNNSDIIKTCEEKIDIENSILLGIEKESKYDYLIVDEDNLIIENVQLLTPCRQKIAILGYSYVKDFLFIEKGTFDINELEIYFRYNQESVDDNLNSEIDENEVNKRDQFTLNMYEKLTAQNGNFSDTLQEFLTLNDDIKHTLFLMLPREVLNHMNKNKTVKADYKRLFKNQISNKSITDKSIFKYIKSKLKA